MDTSRPAPKYVTISVKSSHYEDSDDCLAAAAKALESQFPELRGYDFEPRWANGDTREDILMDVPGYWFWDQGKAGQLRVSRVHIHI